MFSMHKRILAVLAAMAALSACKQEAEPEEGGTGNTSSAGYSLSVNDLASEIQGGGGVHLALLSNSKKTTIA